MADIRQNVAQLYCPNLLLLSCPLHMTRNAQYQAIHLTQIEYTGKVEKGSCLLRLLIPIIIQTQKDCKTKGFRSRTLGVLQNILRQNTIFYSVPSFITHSKKKKNTSFWEVFVKSSCTACEVVKDYY